MPIKLKTVKGSHYTVTEALFPGLSGNSSCTGPSFFLYLVTSDSAWVGLVGKPFLSRWCSNGPQRSLGHATTRAK